MNGATVKKGFIQQFAKSSFSNITTINKFKITVLQLRDKCLFVIVKLDTCFTSNLLMNIFLFIPLCSTEPEQYI